MDDVSRRDPAKIHVKTTLAQFERRRPLSTGGLLRRLGSPKFSSVDVNSVQFFSGLDKS